MSLVRDSHRVFIDPLLFNRCNKALPRDLRIDGVTVCRVTYSCTGRFQPSYGRRNGGFGACADVHDVRLEKLLDMVDAGADA